MFSKDESRNVISFVYHMVMLVAGLIITAIGFAQPDHSESSLIMLGLALVSLGVCLFRYWNALDPTKLKKFLSVISYIVLVIAMFFALLIPISNRDELTSRPLWFGSFFVVIAAFASYSFLGLFADESGAKFEFGNFAVLVAPIVFFAVGFILSYVISSFAILLGVTVAIYLIVNYFSGSPVNLIVSWIFTILYCLIGGFSEKFLMGEYYALVPAVVLVVAISSSAFASIYGERVKNDGPILKYAMVSTLILMAGSFVAHYYIVTKFWMGVLIVVAAILVNWLVYYEIAHTIERKENKGKKSSSSSSGRSSSVDAKTESLVREKLRTYVKGGSYNYARIGKGHVTVSCTSVDCFITYSGDVQVDVEVKIGATDISAFSSQSNAQMVIDMKNHVRTELYKNAKKALEIAASQGAKLSGKYSVEVNYNV